MTEIVYNKLPYTIDVYWVKTNGGLQKYGTVRSGSSWSHQTYSGNAWIAKRKGSSEVAGWVAGYSYNVVIDSRRKDYFTKNYC